MYECPYGTLHGDAVRSQHRRSRLVRTTIAPCTTPLVMAFTVFVDEEAQPQSQLQASKPTLQPHKVFDSSSGSKYQDKENMQSRQELERAEHERCIERGELRCTPSEQLDRWIDYIKWSQRACLGKDVVLNLLERCTKTFNAERSLRNQRKYLRVWINYADMSHDKEGVFEHMWANKIGVTHALYYEAASAMHETGEGTLDGKPDLKRAMKMLAVGIKMQADPVDRLELRKKELKRRALRQLQKDRARRMATVPSTAMQVVAEQKVDCEAVDSERDLEKESAENFLKREQAPGDASDQCPETLSQPSPLPEPEPQATVCGTSSPPECSKTTSALAQINQQEACAVKVFDVTCDECSIECSEESWRIEQADEDLCPTCYMFRKNGTKDQRASVQDAIRQKDGQNIVLTKKTLSRKKTLAAKQAPTTTTRHLQESTNSKLGRRPGQQKTSHVTALKGDVENNDPDDDGPEPWVGTKKAKARRRKRLYKPKFDGEAPCAEDGGFSLFTDKNGRDCR